MKKQELYSKGGLNGAALKWLAILTMTIDHIGVGLLASLAPNSIFGSPTVYLLTRLIGRLAFPIFVFLIIQGYQHTSNLRSYLTRLFLFALVSEVPFDLMVSNQVLDFNHQNIFFTLFIGVTGLAMLEYYEMKNRAILKFLVMIGALLLAEILKTDYGLYGVLFIIGVGIFRDQKIWQTFFGVVMGFAQALTASLAFLPIWFYNGERGRQNKWFFYIYYPAHLFIIFIIRKLLIE